jgi:hypothetical protein
MSMSNKSSQFIIFNLVLSRNDSELIPFSDLSLSKPNLTFCVNNSDLCTVYRLSIGRLMMRVPITVVPMRTDRVL